MRHSPQAQGVNPAVASRWAKGEEEEEEEEYEEYEEEEKEEEKNQYGTDPEIAYKDMEKLSLTYARVVRVAKLDYRATKAGSANFVDVAAVRIAVPSSASFTS